MTMTRERAEEIARVCLGRIDDPSFGARDLNPVLGFDTDAENPYVTIIALCEALAALGLPQGFLARAASVYLDALVDDLRWDPVPIDPQLRCQDVETCRRLIAAVENDPENGSPDNRAPQGACVSEPSAGDARAPVAGRSPLPQDDPRATARNLVDHARENLETASVAIYMLAGDEGDRGREDDRQCLLRVASSMGFLADSIDNIQWPPGFEAGKEE